MGMVRPPRGGKDKYGSMFDSSSTRVRRVSQVLLLGEADFSFARALARELADTGKETFRSMEITATEYGNETDIANRYYGSDFNSLVESMISLMRLGVKEIMCGLNARQLGQPSCTCKRWDDRTKGWEDPSPFWNDRTKFDLIVFNFPHSDQAGRAAKLVRALFKQIRICVDDGRLPPAIVLEMRLRLPSGTNIRSLYKHEEAAEESQFELIGTWPSDLQRWERLGYQHKWTRRDATCRDIGLRSQVWRWKPITRSAEHDFP